MEPAYDLWHLAFANLVQERAPPNVEVLSEVRLTIEPQRADLLLLRRTGTERRDGEARVLHAIWPRLAKVTIVELKSPTRSSFRPGDLVRLWGYGPLYHAANLDDVSAPADLTLLLVVAGITPTLRDQDIFAKILEELPPEMRMVGLTPEQRLAGLAPEQRLEGLTREEQILALSDELLGQFPEAYLRTLPDEVREAVRRRIGRPR